MPMSYFRTNTYFSSEKDQIDPQREWEAKNVKKKTKETSSRIKAENDIELCDFDSETELTELMQVYGFDQEELKIKYEEGRCSPQFKDTGRCSPIAQQLEQFTDRQLSVNNCSLFIPLSPQPISLPKTKKSRNIWEQPTPFSQVSKPFPITQLSKTKSQFSFASQKSEIGQNTGLRLSKSMFIPIYQKCLNVPKTSRGLSLLLSKRASVGSVVCEIQPYNEYADSGFEIPAHKEFLFHDQSGRDCKEEITSKAMMVSPIQGTEKAQLFDRGELGWRNDEKIAPLSNNNSGQYSAAPSSPLSKNNSDQHSAAPSSPLFKNNSGQHSAAPSSPLSKNNSGQHSAAPSSPLSKNNSGHNSAAPLSPLSKNNGGQHSAAPSSPLSKNNSGQHSAAPSSPLSKNNSGQYSAAPSSPLSKNNSGHYSVPPSSLSGQFSPYGTEVRGSTFSNTFHDKPVKSFNDSMPARILILYDNMMLRIALSGEEIEHAVAITHKKPVESTVIDNILNRFKTLSIEKLNHYSKLGEFMREMKRENKMVDVFVHIGNQVFSAHRHILSCHSQFFADILGNVPSKQKLPIELKLQNVTVDAFQVFLQYVYTGEVSLDSDNVAELLLAAEQLLVPHLQMRCKDYINTIAPHQALRILSRAKEMDVTNAIFPLAFKSTLLHFEDLFDKDDFNTMDVKTLCALLSSDDLVVVAELDVFWTALKWVVFDMSDRLKHLIRVMNCVRFPLMSQAELLYCVSVTDLLRANPTCRTMILSSNWLLMCTAVGKDDPLHIPRPNPRNCMIDGKKDVDTTFKIRDKRWSNLSVQLTEMMMSDSTLEEGINGSTRHGGSGGGGAHGGSGGGGAYGGSSGYTPGGTMYDSEGDRGSHSPGGTMYDSEGVRRGNYSPRGVRKENHSPGGTMYDSEGVRRENYSPRGVRRENHSPGGTMYDSEGVRSGSHSPGGVRRENHSPGGTMYDSGGGIYDSEGVRRVGHSPGGMYDPEGVRSGGYSPGGYTTGGSKAKGGTYQPRPGETESETSSGDEYTSGDAITSTSGGVSSETKIPADSSGRSLRSGTSGLSEMSNKSQLSDILVVGGFSQKDKKKDGAANAVERYSSESNEWNHFTGLPEPRNHHAVAVFGGKLYLVGGSDPKKSKKNPVATATTFMYRLEQGQWYKMANMKERRMHHSVCVLFGHVYAIGGQDDKKNILNTVEIFNLKTNSWRNVAPMITARCGFGATTHLNLIYVAGGFGQPRTKKSRMPVLDQMESYDSRTDSWTVMRRLEVPRCYGNLVSVDNFLYLCAGATRQPAATGAPGSSGSISVDQGLTSVSLIDVYDPHHNIWEGCTDLFTARHNAGAIVMGTKIFIIGGVSSERNSTLQTIECFDTYTREWDRSINKLPHPAIGIGCVAIPTMSDREHSSN